MTIIVHSSGTRPTNDGLEETPVSDNDLLCVLEKILKEQKIMNMHLAEMRGEEIKHWDID